MQFVLCSFKREFDKELCDLFVIVIKKYLAHRTRKGYLNKPELPQNHDSKQAITHQKATEIKIKKIKLGSQ